MNSHLGQGPDLSPRNWQPAERALAEQSEMTAWPKQAKLVEGKLGLVAATLSPIAVLAGGEALRQGGNASDAAATVALTQIATALGSYVSFAGTFNLLYYEKKSARVHSLTAGWNTWLGESDPMTIPVCDMGPLPYARKPTDGAEGRKTLVPGFMAGLEAMHRRFGQLSFATLFQPAIAYAEEGLRLSPMLASYFPSRGRYLNRTPEGRAFLNQASGSTPKAGDLFIQTDLARTLRAVAERGSSYMYTGEWGQQFVRAVQREGGKATLEDMQRYQPLWQEPIKIKFLGTMVYSSGRGSFGGYRVLEALNVAEVLQLEKLGPYFHDPVAFKALSSILRATNGEWRRLPPDGRLTKSHAKAIASALGQFPDQEPPPIATDHSDSVVVVDGFGNVACVVHTINTLPWGTTGIVVGGIPISDAAGFQQTRLATLPPGSCVTMGTAPSIAIREGKPTLAIAAIGSSLVPETVRLLVGTLANRLDALTLMSAPPLLENLEPQINGAAFKQRPILVPEGAYDANFLDHLLASGVNLKQKPKQETWRGTAVMATTDPHNGRPLSVETPGVYGFAGSY